MDHVIIMATMITLPIGS